MNLFTRPRRFGKTLNMSMLEHFFSLDGDKRIFAGLDISKETALCEEYRGKYPVISVSLKGIDARNYEMAFDMAVQIMKRAPAKVQYLLESDALREQDKAEYRKLLDDNMSEVMITPLKLIPYDKLTNELINVMTLLSFAFMFLSYFLSSINDNQKNCQGERWHIYETTCSEYLEILDKVASDNENKKEI